MAFNSRGQVVRTYGRHKQRTISAWISPEACTKPQHIFSSPENMENISPAPARDRGIFSLTNSSSTSSHHSDEDWFPGKRTEYKSKKVLKERNVKISQVVKKSAPRKASTRKQLVNGKENVIEKPVEGVEELPPTAKGKRVTRPSRRKKVTADVRSSSQESHAEAAAEPGLCKGKNGLGGLGLVHSPIERSWSSSSKRGRMESLDITFNASCDLFEYSADVSDTGSSTRDEIVRSKTSHVNDSVLPMSSPEIFLPSRQKVCDHGHIDTSTPNDLRRVTRSSRQNSVVTGTLPIIPDTPAEKFSSGLTSKEPHRTDCRCPAFKARTANTPDLTDITNEISVLDLSNAGRAEDDPQPCKSSSRVLQKSIIRGLSPCSVVVTPLSGEDLSHYSSSSIMLSRNEGSVASSCKESGNRDKKNGRMQLLKKATLASPDCSKIRLLSDSCTCHSFKETLTPVKSKATGRLITARQKVLQQCEQTAPVSFTQAIPPDMMEGCAKIGEGVYGEVFRTVDAEGQTIVLKIVPIEGDNQVNGEPQKSFEEILPEIVISRELSALRDGSSSTTGGFITVNGVSCCQGCFPEKLLNEWDEYDKKKSENDRPDFFPEEQLFIMFKFADGGMDLESKTLASIHQAVSIFQQVAVSLAVAEQSLEFEHRDLHWGNVLVIPTSHKSLSFWLEGEEIRVASHGVQAGMIDFTLSRLEKDGCTVYCDLSSDETLFTGRGDPQFDVYRKMKDENGNNWKPWNPHTNVLWLHYLLDKLLNAKTYLGSRRDSAQSSLRRELRSLARHLLSHVSAVEVVRDSGLMEL